MKRIVFVMAAMLCLFGGDAAAQTVKQKVAVYVTGDADAGYKKVIGSKMVTGITRSENYAAVERTADFLAEMAKEQDYQMSGAVSDNQIARLGQQFGVRYVLVADISEVFEAMFVSARMIDVQTGQITAATEASGSVNSIDALTKLAENVVLEIVGAPTYTEDDVKLLGPYTDFDKLHQCYAPQGYHIANKEEIEGIIKNYQMTGKKLSFPIYASIDKGQDYVYQYYTIDRYNNSNSKFLKTESKSRSCPKYTLSCTLFENPNKCSIITLSYINDSYNGNDINYIYGEKHVYKGRRYMGTPKPSIVAGYVYVIKNKKDK